MLLQRLTFSFFCALFWSLYSSPFLFPLLKYWPFLKVFNIFCILGRECLSGMVLLWSGINHCTDIMSHPFFSMNLLAKDMKMKSWQSSTCCKDFQCELLMQHTTVLEQSGNWVGQWSCLVAWSLFKSMWSCQYQNQRLIIHLLLFLSVVELLVFLLSLTWQFYAILNFLLMFCNLNSAPCFPALLSFLSHPCSNWIELLKYQLSCP